MATLSAVLIVLGGLVGLLAPWPLKIVIDHVLGHAPLPPLLERVLGSAAKDPSTKRSLNQARSALAECLGNAGTVRPGPRSTKGRSSANYSDDLPEALLTYVRNNPGQRGEQIAAALATDSPTLRPVMKRLITEGKIETAGQRRGMTYSAV